MARLTSPLIQYIRCCIVFTSTLGGGFALMEASHAHAQTITADPGAWRSMSYANLQAPSPVTATYVDIWKDAIDENNRHYEQRGDRRFSGGNAPVNEAHFVIWSSRRSVVFSVLDTASQCEPKAAFPEAGATVKLCPMRIAIYEGLQVRTLDGGKACFLELEQGASAGQDASGAYASYDVASRTVNTGVIVNHIAVEGCSFDVPLPRQ